MRREGELEQIKTRMLLNMLTAEQRRSVTNRGTARQGNRPCVTALRARSCTRAKAAGPGRPGNEGRAQGPAPLLLQGLPSVASASLATAWVA